MKVCIITIGYELLQGRVVNTNAAFLARKLTAMGHDVKLIACVGDSYDDISLILDTSIKTFDCDLIITTGGLGPTHDDITIDAIAKHFGLEMELNIEAEKEIEEKCRSKGLEVSEERLKMAYMPKGAKPIPNSVGMAPGMILQIQIANKNITLISLPGVPIEMQTMFEQHIERILRGNRVLIESEILVEPGVEVQLMKVLKPLIKQWQKVYVKTHPEGLEERNPRVRIYIALYDDNRARGLNLCRQLSESLINEIVKKLNVKIKILKECSVLD